MADELIAQLTNAGVVSDPLDLLVVAPRVSGTSTTDPTLNTYGDAQNVFLKDLTVGGGSAGAWTPIVNTFVQSKTTATTSAINTTGANFIVAVAAAASGAVQPYTVTDNKSNTYTARTAFTGTSFTLAQIFDCINPTVGSGHTFTLTANGGGNPLATFLVWAFSWSGVSISYIAENGVGGANTSLTSIQTGIVNPAAAASYLAISGLCIPTTGTGSATTSWNPAIGAAFSSGNFNGGWMSWKITGSTDSALWTWTGSSGGATTIALFKGA